MDWFFDNLQFVIAVIVFIVWTLGAAKKQKEAAKEEEARRTGRRPPGGPGADEAERTRQIQEEIRRRILARQRGESAAPPPMPGEQPTVVVFDSSEDEMEPRDAEFRGEGPRPHVADQAAAHTAAILEQQRRLEEQMQALRAARALATAGVPRLPASVSSASATMRAGGTAWKRSLRRDLAHRSSLRRALLLKEVLGEPVGMQRGMPQIPRR